MTLERLFTGFGTVCLLIAIWQGSSAGYLYAKAELAQYLLEDAWQTKLATGVNTPPWPWAQTWPVARLQFPGYQSELLVLADASARNLAFGPAHISHTPWHGQGGNTLIAGHRDSHFKLLKNLKIGDHFNLQRPDKALVYQITEIRIVHQDDAQRLEKTPGESLMLITCYPFDAINPDTPWRYVVRAITNG